jgi:hypothetical protein
MAYQHCNNSGHNIHFVVGDMAVSQLHSSKPEHSIHLVLTFANGVSCADQQGLLAHVVVPDGAGQGGSDSGARCLSVLNSRLQGCDRAGIRLRDPWHTVHPVAASHPMYHSLSDYCSESSVPSLDLRRVETLQ